MGSNQGNSEDAGDWRPVGWYSGAGGKVRQEVGGPDTSKKWPRQSSIGVLGEEMMLREESGEALGSTAFSIVTVKLVNRTIKESNTSN